MNILYVSHEKSVGGATRALLSLVRHAQDAGHVVSVLVPAKKCPATIAIQQAGASIICMRYSWWMVPEHSNASLSNCFKIAYRFTRSVPKSKLDLFKDFDVIHSNSSVVNVGAILSNALDIPHVWHFREFHKDNLIYIDGEKSSIDFINSSKSTVVFVSNAIRDEYARFLPSCSQVVIADGVPYRSCKVHSESACISFAMIGTIQKSKGHRIALDAVKRIKDKGYLNFRLIITGNDPYAYRAELERYSRLLGIDDFVSFHSFTPDSRRLHQEADVELMCSAREAFGLTTAEAGMVGNPVIGSNSGGTPDIILDGVTGFLFEPGSSEALAEKMEKYLCERGLIQSMGDSAHRHISNCYSDDVVFRKVESLYRKLICPRDLWS